MRRALKRHPTRRVLAAAMLLLGACAGAQGAGSDPLATLARRAADLAGKGEATTPAPGGARDISAELAGAEEAIAQAERWAAALERNDASYRVLFAIPSDDERRGALDAATALIAEARRATELVDGAALRADLMPDLGDETMQRLDRALQARQVVLPLLAARAALVIAAQQPGEGRAAWTRPAQELAGSVLGVSPWAECESRLLSGLSRGLVLRRGDDPGPALAPLDAVVIAARSPECSPALRERALIDADLSRSLVLRRSRGPITAREDLVPRLEATPWSLASGAPLPRALLGRDVLLSLALEESAAYSETAQSARTVAAALDRYVPLLPDLDTAQRAALYAHLASVAPALGMSHQDDARRMPAILAMALAEVGGASEQDAIDLLEYVTNADVPAPPALRGDAALALARRLADIASGDAAQRAAHLALGFAAEYPDDARAASVLDLACRSAAAAEEATRDTPAHPAARAVLLQSLRDMVGFKGEVSQREQWRLALVQALQGAALNATIVAAPTDVDAFMLEAAAAVRPMSDAARRTRAVLLLGEGWAQALVRLADSPDGQNEEVMARWAGQLLALAEHPEASFDATLPGWQPPAEDLSLFRARALLALGEARQALAMVAPLAESSRASAPVARRALLLALEASLALCEAEPAERAAAALAVLDGAGSAEPSATLHRLSARAWRRLAPYAQPLRPDSAAPLDVCPDVFALAAAHASLPDRAGMENGRLGWALLLAGRGAEAAAQLERLLRADDPSPPPSLLRGLGEAHLMTGAREPAFAAFRRAVAASPADSADSWHAWTRLLELMSTSPDAPQRAPAIRREIARLRSSPEAQRFPVGLERLRVIEARLGQPTGTGDGTASPAVR